MMDTSTVLLLLGLFFITNTIKFSFGSFSYPDVFCTQRERQALLSFKQGLRDPSNMLSSWSSGEDCCKTWKGVHCHNTTHRVVGLHLRGIAIGVGSDFYSTSPKIAEAYKRSRLGGMITPSLLELKYLNYLDLSLNNFGGIPIPAFLGSLQNLRYLNLSRSGFNGTIPHQLGNLSNLHYLDLGDQNYVLNYFFPYTYFVFSSLDVENLQWLSHLSSLRYHDLSAVNLNKASDHWLQTVNMLPSLSELHLQRCSFQGLLHSPSYVNFTSLEVLDLSYNLFGYSIPNWLFSLTDLVSLKLGFNAFQGPFPGSLQNLTKLRALDLSLNHFNSTIPNWFYNFSSLEYLDLSYNDLQGTISVDISNLTSITNLALSYCKLEGGIPRTLRHLCNLRRISLPGNNFTGELSGILSGCIADSLEYLDLEVNQLSGPLPDQLLGQFKNLFFLSLDRNSFFGPIPKSIASLSKLEIFHISDNPFEGVVSESHFANLLSLKELEMGSTSLILNVSSDWIPPFQLKSLQMGSVKLATLQFPKWLHTQNNFHVLDLSSTGISDTIPTWFWPLTSKITLLNLSHNHIEGELPKFLKSHATDLAGIYLQSNHFEGPPPRLSPNVVELDLSNNSLSGPISDFLCNSANNNNSLKILDLSENHLSGELPDCWMYWPNLAFINLGTNNLTGNVPSSMGSLISLQSLHLHNNNISGDLRTTFENCTRLIAIDLSGNGFSGSIPRWIGKNLTDLLVLSLRSNKFNGGIPLELCHLTSLQILDLAHNNLLGTIPRCFSNLTGMSTKRSTFTKILYIGSTISYIEKALLVMKGMQLEYGKTLGLVASMDLSSNGLAGEIPEELTNLLGLISLNLSKNCLTGKIPEKIGIMGLLESLDFSVNKLSGVIPQSMASLNFLAYLNLSNNNLSGKIPLSTQLQSFNEFSYIGNQGLCGAPLRVNCTRGEASPDSNDGDEVQEDKDGHWIEMESFYISMALGVVVGFWGVFGVLVFKKTWRFAYFRFIEDVKDRVCTLF